MSAAPDHPRPARADPFPWLESRLACAPTVRRLSLGERAALFCEHTQELLELNATADLIWQALAAGRPPAAAAEELQALGASAADALRFVTECGRAWLQAGCLLPADVAERSRGRPDVEWRLRIADLACSIDLHVSAGDPLPREVEAVFGQFRVKARSEGPRISVLADAGRYALLAGGEPRAMVSAERVVPELKAILTDQLSRRVGGGSFLLHAALLARGGKGLLITGSPGAGKTTLSLALAARGFGYGSDDIVRVSAGGEFTGIRFSPASKSGAWELTAPYVPGLRRLPTHLRGDGQRVRYVPVSPFARAEMDGLGWALLLARGAGAQAALEPLQPLAMLTELLRGAFCADHLMRGEVLQAVADRLASVDCRRLVYSDLPAAVALIEEMVGG